MSALCAYSDHVPALTQLTLRVARHSNHVNNTVPSPQPHPESLPLPNLKNLRFLCIYILSLWFVLGVWSLGRVICHVAPPPPPSLGTVTNSWGPRGLSAPCSNPTIGSGVPTPGRHIPTETGFLFCRFLVYFFGSWWVLFLEIER